MSPRTDLQNLIRQKTRRLQKLRDQEAIKGVSVDPSVLIEIEDLRAEIDQLQAELGRLSAGNDDEAASPKSTYCPRDSSASGIRFDDQTQVKGQTFPPLNHSYRDDIANIITFYNQTFIGREREWAEIAQFASEETPGYLLVEAPAGYGKTALTAHLIQRYETNRWENGPKPNLLYFFIRQEGQRHTPTDFLQSLNSQLLKLLKLSGGMPTDLNSLRGQFSELWARALASTNPDQPLLLFVDGLDEQSSGEVTISHLLPANLADYVHIVVTSRPNPDPLQQTALEHPFRQTEVLRLHTFGETEIEALLQDYGAGADDVTRFTSRVQTITQGNPLFARFVCQVVAEQGEKSLAELETNPPVSVEDYFRKQFRQLATLVEGDLAWKILGLLTVTLGGISLEEVAEVLEVSLWRVQKAIDPIQRFLLGQDRFERIHLQLRRALVGSFSNKEQRNYQEKLLLWCRHYQDKGWAKETPPYILAHYAQHLVETNQYQVLYDLICATWMRVKFEATGSHRSFILDLDQAITAALTETPANLVQTVRCCLIYANLAEVAETIPRKILGMLAELGRIEQALNYARLMPEGLHRSEAYLLISDALIEQDRPQEAQTTLEQALIGIDSVKYNQDRAWVLSRVSFNLALIGENKQALQLIEQVLTMVTEGNDVTLPSGIIWTLGTLDKFDRAWDLVDLLQGETEKIEALVYLARTLNEVGERAKALSLFDLAVSTAETTESLGYVGQIAQILTFEQAVDHALKIVSTIESLRERFYTLTEMATIVAEAGDLTKAMEIFDRAFVEAKHNVFALCDLASALFKVGDTERAMVAMSRIPDLLEWETTAYGTAIRLCQMAQIFVEIKRESKAEEILAQVLSITEKIKERKDKVYILSRVIQIMTEIGLNIQALDIFEQACDIVKEIEAGWEKASALQTLAQVSSGLGNHPLTIEVTKQAFMTIGGPSEWEEFDRIVQVMVEIDAFDQALALIRDIDWEHRQDAVLCQLAWAAARQGRMEQALVAVRTISAQRGRLKALQGIAQIFIDMEKSGQAIEIIDLAVLEAGSFEDESTRLPVLNEMAKTLIQLEYFDRALTIIKTIRNDKLRADALHELTQLISQPNILDQILEVAHKSDNDKNRDVVLRGVSQALARIERFDHALTVVDLLNSDHQKFEALSEIATIIAGKEKVISAPKLLPNFLETVYTLPDKRAHAYICLLRNTAQALARHEQVDQALAIITKLDSNSEQVRALGGITKIFIEQGRRSEALEISDQAIEIASSIGLRHREFVINELAEIFFESSMLEQAQKVAQLMNDIVDGVSILCRVGRVLGKKGDKVQAHTILTQALIMAKKVRERFVSRSDHHDYDKKLALSKVTQAFIEIGAMDQAMEVVTIILQETDEPKDFALKPIAQALAKAEEFKHVLTIIKELAAEQEFIYGFIDELPPDMDIEQVLAMEVIDGLAQDGDIDQASALIQLLELNKAKVLLFSAMLEARQFDRALAIAKEFETGQPEIGSLETIILAGQAKASADSGDTYTAMKLVDKLIMDIPSVEHKKFKVGVWRILAEVMLTLNQPDRARKYMANAFNVARLFGREETLQMLKGNVSILATLDQGETLWQIYQAIMEVESWWEPQAA